MNFRDTSVLVAGVALSGAASAVLLDKLGARVLLYDKRTLNELPADIAAQIAGIDAQSYLGRDPLEALDSADLIVVSPGLPPTLPLLTEAHRRGMRVVSEIELGYQVARGEFVSITGTNGKTTTTALTGSIFRDGGRATHVVGNIGVPVTARALETTDEDVLVTETAALQLDDIEDFHPRASAVLNVTPDHLDRYGTLENYTAAKARVFKNQTAADWCVLNYDDPIVRGMSSDVRARILWFSLKPLPRDMEGIFIQNGKMLIRIDGTVVPVTETARIRIPGTHNVQNAMAAAALAFCRGVSPTRIALTLSEFPGVEHRIEAVREVGGVLYVNDSKGTNPDATIKAVEAMSRPVVLILGGYDKHADFHDLMNSLTRSVRHIVVLGQTADQIEKAAHEAGICPVERAASFQDAVGAASRAARPGDVVLLSPACASWDMFENFEARGARFKELVRNM